MQYIKNVVTLQLDTEKCIGCGVCTQVCPHGVLSIEGKKVKIINRNWCMECGGCAKNCPVAALSVNAGVGCAGSVILGFFSRKGSANCLQPKSTEFVK